jgi:hypothetical protein
MKTFEETDPVLGPDGQVSSRDHPFQTFQWADYSAKPGHEYVYTAIPLYGKPATLKEGPAVKVQVSTEPELGKPHSVFFNRGSVASQEYTRRFQDKSPKELEGEEEIAAYRWLSRGLEEALLAFVERASGSGWGLRGAFYELRWQPFLAALKAADKRGVDVSILYDGIEGESAKENNEIEIAAAKAKGICRPRTSGELMHNKFLVLTRKGKPLAVWTGSTNITENGIFGHMNCGHMVEDSGVARDFLAYWEQLCTNPELKDERIWIGEHNPAPPEPGTDLEEITTVFSPHTGNDVLDWYRDISGAAKEALMMTFAFGMNDRFKEVYEREGEDILRYALMDKASPSGKKAYMRAQEKRIQEIRNLPNVVVAIGNRIVTNSFDRWLKELGKITKEPHVPWVHTKFMLVDPLGSKPITVTGSANWSTSSTSTNNENMLIIEGDKRVADIYLGEFMRLHSHYAFREAVAKGWGDDEEWKPQYLVSGPRWQDDYFDEADERYWKRRYFAQSG